MKKSILALAAILTTGVAFAADFNVKLNEATGEVIKKEVD